MIVRCDAMSDAVPSQLQLGQTHPYGTQGVDAPPLAALLPPAASNPVWRTMLSLTLLLLMMMR